MDKDPKPQPLSGLTGNLLAVVALLLSGALILRSNLESSRPVSNDPAAAPRRGEQAIDARLWQDPLTAVERAREANRKRAPGEAGDERITHAASKLNDAIRMTFRHCPSDPHGGSGSTRECPRVIVLAVMLPGGPYAEYVESRRRTRYAVLAGLNASQYEPVDAEHLRYFFPSAASTAAAGSAVARAALATPLPRPVAYEWFKADLSREAQERAPPDPECTSCQVLVLWLDESQFYEAPHKQLQELREELSMGAAADLMRWLVIGPASARGFQALVDEVHETAPAKAGRAARLASTLKASAPTWSYYSHATTLTDKELLYQRRAAGESMAIYLREGGVNLLRTIADDDVLKRVMLDELELRGLQGGAGHDEGCHRAARPATGAPAVAPPTVPVAIGATAAAASTPAASASTSETPASPPNWIAVFSEWDTPYGRASTHRYRADKGNRGFCIEAWTYVRGLDGRMPEEAAAPPTPRTKAGDTKATVDVDNGGTYIEPPEGQNQFDYLRRLARLVRDQDDELRGKRRIDKTPHHHARVGFGAIGVLGNDVYDKLLVMKALRAELPSTLFFTSDFDARFMSARELPFTRNLIVASGFGLRLRDELQRGAPPFRDTYQTSSFFSTLLALEKVRRDVLAADAPAEDQLNQAWLDERLAKARVFEVSRTGVFDFSPVGGGKSVADEKPGDCSRKTLDKCADIHPPASDPFSHAKPEVRFVLSVLAIAALWLPLYALTRRRRMVAEKDRTNTPTGAFERRSRPEWLATGLGIAVAALLVAWQWPAFAAWLTRGGKPLTLVDGVSTWPTLAVWLVTCWLCAYLWARGSAALTDNLDAIGDHLDLHPARRVLLDEHRRQQREEWSNAGGSSERAQLLLRRWLAIHRIRFSPSSADVTAATEALIELGISAQAVAFWKHCIVITRPLARTVRSIECLILAGLLAWFFWYAFGEATLTPQRGDLSKLAFDAGWLVSTGAVALLIFWVFDATLLCICFINDLRNQHGKWPRETEDHFKRYFSLHSNVIEEWINLRFVAMRSACVGGLIYYPFIVLSLLVVAHASFFTNWPLTAALPMLLGTLVAIALACAIALRYAAERSRDHALERIDDALLRARSPAHSGAAAQLELLRERVASLREGAFEGFLNQRPVRAALLPIAALGGTTLIDYFAIAGL